ncbi:VOC family protein [Rhodopseudomonas palustris]|uniref:VOC family protein n=1 Tax=Rhodopseudomonas palustris TaxID=1076 RepID=UPI002ACD78DB|nr:VOC family protein [Rhodopseudomonas palustris]WQH00539.1 VOC family protein [Rhodopseudomonas palustris]
MTSVPAGENLELQLCYVRLGLQEPGAAATFVTDILGLQAVPNDLGEHLFRSDERAHTLCLTDQSEPPAIGIELLAEVDLDAIGTRIREAGFDARTATDEECRRRNVRHALLVRDASGNAIDLVVRPARSGRRYFPSRDAGVIGLQGIGLRSRNVSEDLKLWTAILGARVSDWVGDVAYLAIDEKHHRIGLYPSDRAGLVYVSFAVESLDAIMQNNYFAQERQIKILHGPGREPASGQMFLRFAGPEGHVFSYGYGMSDIGAKHRCRQFSPVPSSLCEWGSDCSEIPELQRAVG